MIKLFIDVWPNRNVNPINLSDKDSVKMLLEQTEVETSPIYDGESSISLLILDAADDLYEYLAIHGLNVRVGILYNYSLNYPGWMLVIETDNVYGSINPLVTRFFSWKRTESQSILSFNDLMEK